MSASSIFTSFLKSLQTSSNGELLECIEEGFRQVMLESINDKFLFKSVFMVGGPGSGKSYITDSMFSGQPVVVVNSDNIYETLLTRHNLPFLIDPSNVKIYNKQMEVRNSAIDMTSERMKKWANGMLPLVIDGTGRNYDRISYQKRALNDAGYDTSMIFINTSLDVALQRVFNRKRKLPSSFVMDAWQAVQNNMGKFQNLFSSDGFKIVDNTNELSGRSKDQFEDYLMRLSMKILNEPLKNKRGIEIIRLMQGTGKKYLSDNEDEKPKIYF